MECSSPQSSNFAHLRDRQCFYRLATLAQELFYFYQGITFDYASRHYFELERKPVDADYLRMFPGSKTAEGILDIHGLDMSKIPEMFLNPSADIMQFPMELFDPESPNHDNEVKSVLVWCGCQKAASFFMHFFSLLPPGLVVKAERVEHNTKGEKLIVRFREPRGEDALCERPRLRYYHTVVKVALRSGEVYAVDLTGAQYGHYEPVVPWEEYKASRILGNVRVVNEPSPKRTEYIKLVSHSMEELVEEVRKAPLLNLQSPPVTLDYAVLNMNLCIFEWLELSKNNIVKMLYIPSSEFSEKMDSMLDSLHMAFSNEEYLTTLSKTSRGMKLRAAFKGGDRSVVEVRKYLSTLDTVADGPTKKSPKELVRDFKVGGILGLR